jgi:DNA-binding transcriptional LysR family regulator
VLFRQQLVLVLPRRHRLAAKRPVRWKDLAAEPLLMLDPTTRTGTLLRSYFAKIGFSPRVALDSGSFEVIKRYVAEGIGVSFLPRIAVEDSDELKVVELPRVPAVPIGTIRRRRAYQTRAEREFTRVLCVWARNFGR